MKKIAIFGSIAIALLASICFTACNNVAIENPEPEFYTVKLGWTGEILDVSYEPMATRAATNDLYGILVYSKEITSSSTTVAYWDPYAYGLFDDPNNITITLRSGYKYGFEVIMVKDGKNRIYNKDGEYFAPFKTIISNEFICQQLDIYGQIDNMIQLEKYFASFGGSTSLIYGNSYKSYERPNIETFYGELIEYIPDGSSNVKIDMKRNCFGAKFIVGGKLAVDGKLMIQIDGAPEIELALTEGEDLFSDVFTFNSRTKDDYTENLDVSLCWIRTDGTTVPLGTHKITFKRNTTTVVEVNIDNVGGEDNEDNEEGVSIDIPDSETGAMPDGVKVIINNGVILQ